MARTLGIELAAGRCALVELSRRGTRVRLKQFVSIDAGSDEPERLAGDLRRVRRELGLPKRARAVVWSAASLVPTLDGDYHDRVEALRLAGFVLDASASPPEALSILDGVLGRDARASAAYVVLNPDGAALAVVRGGELIIGHEFDWSALEDPRKPDPRALGRRLGAAARRVLLEAGAAQSEISRVALCGALPQLRAVTQPLGEALGRPIETLDTIEGVETTDLPVSILALQKDLAGLRLAWAMAEGPASRAPRVGGARTWRRPIAAAAALTVGAAAIVLACWPREHPVSTSRQPPATPAPVRTATMDAVSPASAVDQSAPTHAVDSRQPEPAPILAPEGAARSEPRAQVTSPAQRTPARGVLAARPPSWKVRSILTSPDRRLAIIDGRIVGPGDRVGREVVIDIGATEVTFADTSGREGRVQLWEARSGLVVR